MMYSSVAHVLSDERDNDGRRYAMTMFNRQEKGVLVYAGRLLADAETKVAEEITAKDYAVRETVSFVRWQDIHAYFDRPGYRALVKRLAVEHKRNDSPSYARAHVAVKVSASH